MTRTWMKKTLLAAIGFIGVALAMLPLARAVPVMNDYTWYPLFMQKTVPPNILFILDLSDAQLQAAYGDYPLSFNNAASYSSNYAGTGLTGTVSDTFDPARTYYGMFDPLRCYTYGTSFESPANGPVSKLNNDVSKKCDATGTSPSTTTAPWDGNFLNWLAMRKVDVSKKVFLGGHALPAPNVEGEPDSLQTETPVGLNGSANDCAGLSKPCWRYVKFVRSSLLAGRVNTTDACTSGAGCDTAWTSGSAAPLGPGQVTASGTTVTAFLGAGPTSFSSTFANGDIIKIGSFVPKNVTGVTDNQHLTFSPGAFSPDITNATTYTRYFPKPNVTYPGSVSVTANSNTVTGSSTSTPTAFTTSFAAGADAIQIRVSGTTTDNTDPIRLVSSISSNTLLTSAATFGTIGAAPYTIFKPSGASTPGTVGTSMTIVTGTGVTSPTNFSNTFVGGDAIIVGSEAQNVSVTPTSTTSLTISLAFSSGLPLGTTYQTKTHGPGTAGFTNNQSGVDGTTTTFNSTFLLGDLIRIGTQSQVVAFTPTSASGSSALTIAAKASATTSGAYTPYRPRAAATTGPGTLKVSAAGTITGTGTSFNTTFRVGDLIKVGTQVATVKAIATATSMTTDTDFPPISTASNYSVYAGPGTVSASAGTNTVNGTGTTFTNSTDGLSPGDIIRIGAENLTVSKVVSDTQLKTTTNLVASPSGSTYTRFRATTGDTPGPGTVDNVAGSTTVSGNLGTVSTKFMYNATTNPGGFRAGDAIKVGTEVQVVCADPVLDTALVTCNPFTASVSNASYAKLVSSGVTGAGTGPASASASGTVVNGVPTVTSTLFTATFAIGDIIKITDTSEPQVVASFDALTPDTLMTTVSNFAASMTGSAYSAFSLDSAVQPGTVTTASTTAVGSSSVTSTAFLTTFQIGDQIQIGGQTRTITSITDDHTLDVDPLTPFSPDITTPSAYANVAKSLSGPGTVTTNGTTTVTGSGTNFQSRFRTGERIRINGVDYTIDTIDPTAQTLTTAAVVPAFSGAYFGPDGVYFGVGEGSNSGRIYINQDGTPEPFTSSGLGNANVLRNVEVNLLYQPGLTVQQRKDYQHSQALGFLQTFQFSSLRSAVMVTNGNGKAGTIQMYFDGSFNPSDINATRNAHISQFAALSEATYEGLCYYRLTQEACYNNSGGDFVVGGSGATVEGQGDPFFFACLVRDKTTGLCTQTINKKNVNCCQSFILMISPGISSSDGNAPDIAAKPFPNGVAPSVCMFGISSCGADALGISDTVNGWLDNVAYYGNTHDVRDQTSGTGAVTGTQNVVFYAVNAMGGQAGATLLASAAKYGGFIDQNNDKLPDAAGQDCTYPIGSNLSPNPLIAYTLTNGSSPEWDVDKNCIPDTFFDASGGGDLLTQINNAIAAILKRAASGTSVSVLATSSTGEGAIYQAYFLPETAKLDGTKNVVSWYGFTQGLFIDTFGNIREDSDGDGRLVLDKDKIITLSFDSSASTVNVLRCPDNDADGKADTTEVGVGSDKCTNNLLSDVKPIWEAGARLAYLDPGTNCALADAGKTCRRILTWIDADNNKLVGATTPTGVVDAVAGEVIEFTVANKAALCPYLNGTAVSVANVATCGTSGSLGQTEAANLINFHRGFDGVPLGLRDRTSAVDNPDSPNPACKTSTAPTSCQRVWKLGDVVDATPTVVAAPKERFDVIYGDATYTTFFLKYKNRRQVGYVGANDGMLHAVNAGFFNAGDDPCTIPTGTPGAGTNPVEHGYFTLQPFANNPHTASQCSFAATARTSNPKLGAELWAFIPQALLPHLKWHADKNYTHVAYMDLKPKVTDARIFCDSGNPNTAPNCYTGQPGTGTHPGGWGTILIGGMRFGGSCGACEAGATGGVPMTVTAEFVSGTTSTRTFYASYFVLDITDPEQDPVLLWTFTDANLGLTSSFPAVLRVSPTNGTGSGKTDATKERWLAVFGTGPTGYAGISTQTAKFFVVDIAKGPKYQPDVTDGTAVGNNTCLATVPCVKADTADTAEQVRVFATPDANSFMGDVITLDSNLDFKTDVIYAGNVITTGASPAYIGKMYRLTTGALSLTGTPATVASWGITGQVPTTLLQTFTTNGTTGGCVSPLCKVGPVTAAPTVSSDNANNIWLFFGSGRFLSTGDKTDPATQYFFGVKDPCASVAACTQTAISQSNGLLDVSGAVVCNPCATGTEVTGVGTAGTNTDLGKVQDSVLNADGWFTKLSNVNPVGNTAAERSLSTPTILGGTVFFTTFIPTDDICTAAGSGYLYALYYLTGTAYKESAIGSTSAGGTTTMKKSISLGTGLPSQMAVQIGAEGSGASGSTGSSSGCAGRVTGFIQASTGVLDRVCGKPALSSWSRMLSWRDL